MATKQDMLGYCQQGTAKEGRWRCQNCIDDVPDHFVLALAIHPSGMSAWPEGIGLYSITSEGGPLHQPPLLNLAFHTHPTGKSALVLSESMGSFVSL